MQGLRTKQSVAKQSMREDFMVWHVAGVLPYPHNSVTAN